MNKEKASHLQNVTILFDSAWYTYKKHFQTLLKINLVPVIVGMATLAAFGLAGDFTKISAYLTKMDVIGVIGLVLGVSVITVAVSSLNYIAQVVALGNDSDDGSESADVAAGVASSVSASTASSSMMPFPSIFPIYNRASQLLFPYFWVMFLAGLAVAFGMIFLIVPGLIFAVWFAFSSFFLILGNGKVANGAKATEFRGRAALRASKQYVKGIWLEVLIRLVIAMLLGLLLNIALAIFKSFVADILQAPAYAVYSAALANFLDFAYQLVVMPYFVVYGYELYMDVMHSHASAHESMPADEASEVGGETGETVGEQAASVEESGPDSV
jgi:hypothetical protein